MRTLLLDKEGNVHLPPELRDYRKLKTPWRTITVGKPDWIDKPSGFGQVKVTQRFRYKERGDKPYVEEGTIEIDGVLYGVERKNG